MKKVKIMCGYGSLTGPETDLVNLDTSVRLKGSGAPCLQSCFQSPFTLRYT